MSLNQIKIALEDFINNKNHNDLITLSGKWGVGKTYFWDQVIESQIEQNKKLKYSYVSLFGVSSLTMLKNAIIANQFRANTTNRDKIDRIFAKIRNSVQQSPFIKSYTGSLIDEIVFSNLEEMIICFDDIERKGKDLTIKDFIGLVTQLKEKKKCKIVIILNESSMKEEDIEEYNKHIEKVIDTRLEFDRTYAEALQCIIPKTNNYFDFILEKCTKLQLKNLRIIQRINRYIDDLKLDTSNFDNELVKDVINSIVLFAFCYFNKDSNEELPTFRYFKNYISEYQLLYEEFGKEQYEKWYNFINNYGYSHTNELYTQLMSYFETGLLDKSDFNILLEKQNSEIIEYKKYKIYDDVWYKFRNTFNQKKSEFLDELLSAYTGAFNSIELKNFNSIILILKALGENEKAEEIIEEFFKKKVEYISNLDLRYHNEPLEFDPDLKRKFNEMINKSVKQKPLNEILNKVLSDSWSNDDQEMLKIYKVDDYYYLFTSDNENVGYYVSELIKLSKSTSDSFLVNAGRIAMEALKKISKESEFNKIKLERVYNLSFSDMEEENE